MWDSVEELQRLATVWVTPAVLVDVYAHARDEYPLEACGLILETAASPSDATPMTTPTTGATTGAVRRGVNVQDALHAEDAEAHPLTSEMGFCLAPQEQLFLARSFRNSGPVRVLYHSHIDIGAYFSMADRAGATFEGRPLYRDLLHMVVDCRADGVRGARLYAWVWDDFREVAAFGVG